jgi:LPXTG-motif cell wall-anchored protein
VALFQIDWHFYSWLQSGGMGVNTRRKFGAMVASAALVTAFFVGGGSSLAGAVAIPGDPTPAECAVIAQQAVDKGISFAEELANQGGGNCPIPAVVTTTSSTVLVLGNTVVNAVTTSSTAAKTTAVPAKVLAGALPRSGSDAATTLIAGGVLVLVGGTILLLNRRRTSSK